MTTTKGKHKRPKAIVLTSHPGGHGPNTAQHHYHQHGQAQPRASHAL